MPNAFIRSGSSIRVPTNLGLDAVDSCVQLVEEMAGKEGCEEISLDFTRIGHVYPNGMIPLIGLVRRWTQSGIRFTVVPPAKATVEAALVRAGWFSLMAPAQYSGQGNSPHGTGAQRFSNGRELNPLINRMMDMCLQLDCFAPGVLEILEWSVNEITSNILDHAGVEEGYLQVHHYKTNEHFAFVVCDTGLGIPHSMRTLFPAIATDHEAIQQAIGKGVTSKPGSNQGLGLAGIVAVAKHASGYCKILSGGGRLAVTPKMIHSGPLGSPYPGTVVELQFETRRPIDVPKTLFGYELTSYLETAFESQTEDVYDVRLTKFAETFGNRPTGKRIRTAIENMLQKQSHKLRIHMEDIRMIASSFADELFGRLFETLGPEQFKKRIELRGVNATCQSIIDAAIGYRSAKARR